MNTYTLFKAQPLSIEHMSALSPTNPTRYGGPMGPGIVDQPRLPGAPNVGVPGAVGQVGGLPQSAGIQYTDVSIPNAIWVKQWPESRPYHDFQETGQYIWSVVNNDTRMPGGVTPVHTVTPPQFNDLLRHADKQLRSLGGRDDDDRDGIENAMASFADGGDAWLFGDKARSARIASTRANSVWNFQSQQGIADMFMLLGVINNSTTKNIRSVKVNKFVHNVTVQGPMLVDNVFQPIMQGASKWESKGVVGDAQHCCWVLKRKKMNYGEVGEFQVLPWCGGFRPSMEEREYYDNSEVVHYAHVWYAGQVKDVIGTPSGALVREMLGIDNSWRSAYQAHGRCNQQINMVLGQQRHHLGT